MIQAAQPQHFPDHATLALVGKLPVLSKQKFSRGLEELLRLGIACQSRRIVAGTGEVLISGRSFLPIPTLFVHHCDSCQQREPLQGEGDMCQIGDGTVAVLKIEGVEKLLRLLLVELGQRLLHGKRGSRVFGHRVGLHFRLDAIHRVDIG